MKDRAAKIQKIANDYELLAIDCEKKQARYPELGLQKDAQKFREKSAQLSAEAKLAMFREDLEDLV